VRVFVADDQSSFFHVLARKLLFNVLGVQMVIKDLDVYSKCVCVLFGRCAQNKSGSSNTAVEKTRETCQKKVQTFVQLPSFLESSFG